MGTPDESPEEIARMKAIAADTIVNVEFRALRLLAEQHKRGADMTDALRGLLKIQASKKSLELTEAQLRTAVNSPRAASAREEELSRWHFPANEATGQPFH